jgi:dephospho-CoA kinase
MLARGSDRDGVSIDKLKQNDVGEEKIFQTSETEKMADYTLLNDGTAEDFFASIKDFYDNFLVPRLD